MERTYTGAQRIALVRKEIEELLKEGDRHSLLNAQRLLEDSGANNKKLKNKIDQLIKKERLSSRKESNLWYMKHGHQKMINAVRCRKCFNYIASGRGTTASWWRYYKYQNPKLDNYRFCCQCRE